MAFRYRILLESNLAVIVFRGNVSPAEEGEAFVTVISDPALEPNARMLAYRVDARMSATPPDVRSQVGLLQHHAVRMGRPRVAVVVADDYDFGMNRMLELTADGKVDHDFRVFRELESACEFLGLHPDLARELVASLEH